MSCEPQTAESEQHVHHNKMQSLLLLMTFCSLLTVYLYVNDSNPAVSIAEFSMGLASDWSVHECEIPNLESLRKSAIVYTWVNGTEDCYNVRRQKAGLSPGGSSRDKEMGELKYSIRSLLKFAPWLEGTIYIVTPGQIPSWLDTSNPRIKVVDQDDLLPKDKTKMPNFDTNVIEQYLYKIPGLTDIFIHMNDDYLFIKNVPPTRFFTCDGGIRFLTEINHIRHVPAQKSNVWLASVRNTVEMTDAVYGGEHVYNFIKHAPFVYSRLAFEKIHQRFGNKLDATLINQLRAYEDYNVPLLHQIYMHEEGARELGIPIEFNPLSECDDWLLVRVSEDNVDFLKEKFDSALRNRGPEILYALNDEYNDQATAQLVNNFYQQLLPQPGAHELPPGTRNDVISNYHGENCQYDRQVIPLLDDETPAIGFETYSLRQDLVSRANALRQLGNSNSPFKQEEDSTFFVDLPYLLGLALAVCVVMLVVRFNNPELGFWFVQDDQKYNVKVI